MLIECRTILFGIYTHTTKLIYIKRSAETTNALLLEYGRSAILVLHGKITNNEKWRENYQCYKGYNKVKNALYISLNLVHSVVYICIFHI